MTIEDEIKRIMELWENIEYKTKIDLANIWEERKELETLEAEVERLEPKVIKLLEVIPTLKRHSHEYHAHTVHLIKLIRHIEPREEWLQKIKDDLDYMSAEMAQAREKIKSELQRRATVEKPKYLEQYFLILAKQSYQLLLQGKEAPLKPIYLALDRKTFEGPEFAPKILKFRETRGTGAPFIAFIKEDNGLLFPNHKIYYIDSMSDIFKNLTERNWREVKPKIEPFLIKKDPDGLYKLVEVY